MKKHFKYLVVLSLLFLSCGQFKSYHFLEAGGIRANSPNFKFADIPSNYRDTTLIDINAIYVQKVHNAVVGPYVIDTSYSFIKFFKNGQIFLSIGYKHFPTIDEINNYNAGDIGYYKIVDDEIIAEVFRIRYPGSFWGCNDYNYYKIMDNETIKLYAQKEYVAALVPYKRLISDVYCDIYKKYKIKSFMLVAEPDW